jgi:hypothetical protein
MNRLYQTLSMNIFRLRGMAFIPDTKEIHSIRSRESDATCLDVKDVLQSMVGILYAKLEYIHVFHSIKSFLIFFGGGRQGDSKIELHSIAYVCGENLEEKIMINHN